MFRVDVEEMCKSRSPYYLQKWVDTFKALHVEAVRGLDGEPSQGSVTTAGSLSLEDLNEYWADVNDGMDVEGTIANAGNTTQEDGIHGGSTQEYEVV